MKVFTPLDREICGITGHGNPKWPSSAGTMMCLGLAVSLLGGVAAGQSTGVGGNRSVGDWVQRGTLLPGSGYGVVDNYFGRSVSASGSNIVVGAPSLGGGTGLTHILDVQGDLIMEEAVLSSSLAQLGDEFGHSVCTWYGTVFVGAPGEDAGAGSVHAFDQSTGTWQEFDRLVSPSGLRNSGFGSAVSLSRSSAAIGAPGEDKVYIFNKENGVWTLDSTINSPAPKGEFGQAVAFDGTNLVVGAPEVGRAFLYTNSGLSWTFTQELFPLASTNTEEFGTSVALDSTLVAVSAPREGGQGEVHVYSFDGFTWSQETLLVPASATAPELSFGEAVSIEGETIAVGSPGDDLVYGSVFLFERHDGVWGEAAQLIPPPGDGVSEGNFGRYVALYGGVVLANLGLEDSPVFTAYAGSVTVWGKVRPSLVGQGSANVIHNGHGNVDRLRHSLRRVLRR